MWEVAAGEGGAYVSADRGMDRSGIINSWVCYGENAVDGVAPVQATVEDTDPTSPTCVTGPFGRVRGFYSSATLTTVGNCQAAGAAQLANSLRPNATADITSLPNPCLEPGDVLRVVYPDGTRELHQVSSFTVSLDTSGGFTLATISAQEAS